jgi:ABC-2 type transport system ATP-binding protein
MPNAPVIEHLPTPGDAPPAVRDTGLTKRYGRRPAVEGLDLELPRGVVAGFVGPNGSGKTTTMAMLLGLVRPSAGTGTVLGEPIEHPSRYLHRVGALIETPAFYPSLTGRENLRLFATAGRHDADTIDALLSTVGLDGRGDDRFREYSLGMKQRLGIAAALLGDPELLVLDEPTNGLDPQGVREMRTLIGGLAGAGRTVLVSSHDLSELEQVCDWLVLIDTGAVLYQGPTGALLDAGLGALVAVPEPIAALGALRDALRSRGFVVDERERELVVRAGRDGESARPGGAGVTLGAVVNRAAFDAGITLAELRPLTTTLEDQFLAMTRGDRP